MDGGQDRGSVERALLTGMSGAGKSTVIVALAARGLAAIDLGRPEWSETAPHGEWVWREDRVQVLLSREGAGVLFVSGCATDQVRFYPHFDHIILLSAPRDVLLDRLATRTSNAFGKRPEELAQVLRDLDETEPRLRRAATAEIDTSVPLDVVVAAILRLTQVADDGHGPRQ